MIGSYWGKGGHFPYFSRKNRGSVPLFLLVVMLSFLSACGGEKPPSSPKAPPEVAMVNGEAINLPEFEKSVAAETALAKGGMPLKEEETESLKEAVLDNLIREKIMLQRAREIYLAVGEEELSARIEEIRKDYNGDRFGELFGAGGIDYAAWKEALRTRMLFEKLIARDVNARIQVTDDEAERYYIANRKAFATDRRVRVAQIVLPDRGRAEAILKRLKTGEDFDKVAREVSIGPEAVRGGDLGFFERGVMPEAIDRMVFSLPVEKVSRIAQSPYGFHIFKVLGQEGAGGRKFADVKEKVIADLKKQREAGAYKIWIEGLKAKAVIRINRPLPGGPSPVQPEMTDARPPAVPEKH
ncbi:MAG: peptidylprolyl isomerase [Deltaproteobacteria bacterium]|nr:peptidylprolyl isomerase [Deltaproteobacteria bacterium]